MRRHSKRTSCGWLARRPGRQHAGAPGVREFSRPGRAKGSGLLLWSPLVAKFTPLSATVSMPDAVSRRFPPRGNAWRSRDVLRVAAIVFGLYFVLRLLWFANALVLVAFLGVLFGLAIAAGVDGLRGGTYRARSGRRRSWSRC